MEALFPENPKRPNKGDKLFVVGPPGSHNAYLSNSNMWDAYAQGYRLAADLLSGHIAESPYHSSLLGYPIVFLYRQYLELRIKELGLAAAEFLAKEYAVPTDHNLLKLWQGVRADLHEVFAESAEDLEAVEERIEEFCSVDPSSYTFRYPADTKGKPTLPSAPKYVEVDAHGWPIGPPTQPGLKQVDVSHLKQTMQSIAAVLDGCSDGLYEAQRAKWDAWAEAAHDYEAGDYEPGDYEY